MHGLVMTQAALYERLFCGEATKAGATQRKWERENRRDAWSWIERFRERERKKKERENYNYLGGPQKNYLRNFSPQIIIGIIIIIIIAIIIIICEITHI